MRTFAFALCLMLAGLTVYAAESGFQRNEVNHSFNFGSATENAGIEVLDYRYGSSQTVGTYGDDYLKRGHIGQGTNVHGDMPVGEFLYVKWRVLSTGKEYEDRVDLKSRLPSNMTHKIVHFDIKDSQLRIYVIEGNDASDMHAPEAADCPSSLYKDFRCTVIYPKHWANF